MKTAYLNEIEIGNPNNTPTFVSAYSKTISFYDFLTENGKNVIRWEHPTRGGAVTFVEINADGFPTGKYFSLLNQVSIKIRRDDIYWGFAYDC